MDYSAILEALNKASLFDLHRLQVAIGQQLEDPKRLSEIKKCLQPGQKISYFDSTENRLIEARILKIMRTKVSVENIDDQARGRVPLYYVNLDNVNTDIINSEKEGRDKGQLKVGDMVGFQDKQNHDVYGKVIRLNQKTATIMTSTNSQWRVAYQFLHLIHDIEQKASGLIENRSFGSNP